MPKHIDVDTLKEWVENWFEKNRHYHPYSKSNDIPIPKLYDILEQMPSIQLEPQWIPVSERLPEVNGRYLVTRGLNACGAMWNRVYIINYSDLMGLKSERIWWNGNVGKSDFERIDDVTAWMPLSKPYKEEKNNAEVH